MNIFFTLKTKLIIWIKIRNYYFSQILNDAFALYMSGDITYELAMEIVSSLEHEDSYVVWDAALSGFQMLKIDGAVRKMTKQLYNEWKVQ